jgi:hypothetical protein
MEVSARDRLSRPAAGVREPQRRGHLGCEADCPRDRRRCEATPFLDEAQIDVGADFEDEILTFLERADELVVLITPWALERPYVGPNSGPPGGTTHSSSRTSFMDSRPVSCRGCLAFLSCSKAGSATLEPDRHPSWAASRQAFERSQPSVIDQRDSRGCGTSGCGESQRQSRVGGCLIPDAALLPDPPPLRCGRAGRRRPATRRRARP